MSTSKMLNSVPISEMLHFTSKNHIVNALVVSKNNIDPCHIKLSNPNSKTFMHVLKSINTGFNSNRLMSFCHTCQLGKLS